MGSGLAWIVAWDGLVTGLVWGVATALVRFPSALRDRDAQVVASVAIGGIVPS